MIQRRLSLKRSQGGFGIISALLALVIGSVVSVGVIEGKATEVNVNSGRLQGDLLNLMRDATNNYAMENYPALQQNQPVTKNGVTLSGAQAMTPQIADLIGMGYLPTGTSAQARLSSGVYRVSLARTPAGCAGVACNITGQVYIDQPIRKYGSTDMNGVAIGALMDRVGGDVLVSLPSSPANLQGMNGTTLANPVAGNPAGVVGTRVGFGAAGFGRFLIINDPRDPNFQGNLTVAGQIQGQDVTANNAVVATNSVGVGTGLSGCRLGEILANGSIVSRAMNCVQRAWFDAPGGNVVAADTSGNPRAIMWGSTGDIHARNSAGSATVQLEGATGRIGTSGYAPGNLPPGWGGGVTAWDVAAQGSVGAWDGTRVRAHMNRNGDMGVFDGAGNYKGGFEVSNGGNRVTSEYLRAFGWATPGAPCGANRFYADFTTNASGPGLVMCNGSVWVAVSMVASDPGAWCPTNGAMAVSSSGVSLICQGNQYMSIADRMGKFAVSGTYLVGHGSWLGKPTCGSGGTPKIYFIPQAIDSQKLYVNFRAADYGGSWQTLILDGDGWGRNGNGIAQIGCFY